MSLLLICVDVNFVKKFHTLTRAAEMMRLITLVTFMDKALVFTFVLLSLGTA